MKVHFLFIFFFQCNDKGPKWTEEENEQIVCLLRNLGVLFQESRGDLVLALDCAETFYDFCLKTYSEDHISTAHHPLNDLMLIYKDQGKNDLAIEYDLKALAIKTKVVLGIKHLVTAIHYYNLGLVYSEKR